MKFNPTEYPDNTAIPPNKYEAVIGGIQVKHTQQGDVMWVLKFKVETEEYGTITIPDNFVFNKVGGQRMKKLLKVLGYDITQELDLTTEMLIGKSLLIDVTNRDYNGETQNSVAFAGFSPIGSGVDKPVNDDDNIPF